MTKQLKDIMKLSLFRATIKNLIELGLMPQTHLEFLLTGLRDCPEEEELINLITSQLKKEAA